MPPIGYRTLSCAITKILACILFCVILVVSLWVLIPHRSTLAQKSGVPDDVYNKNYYKHYVCFQTSDHETLSGWFFYRGQDSDLVVCYPGNCCNAGMFTSFAEQDQSQSYLMLNYRGYGASTGRLNEENMVRDACEVIRYYRNKYKIKSVKLLGFSLGTGVAIQVAAQTPDIKKVVLAAPFSSMAETCNLSEIRKLIIRDHFNSLSYAPSVSAPIHIVYSEEDITVRPESTQKLIKEFPGAPIVQKLNGSHNDVINLPMNQKIILQALHITH